MKNKNKKVDVRAMEHKACARTDFNELNSLLIEIAGGKAQWKQFLDLFVASFQLKSANLVILNRHTMLPVFHEIGGEILSQEAVVSYAEHFATSDPVVSHIQHAVAGEVHFVHELVDEHRFLASDYYLNWCSKYDIRDGGSIKLFIESDHIGELIFNRTHDQPLFDPDEDKPGIQALAIPINKTLQITRELLRQPNNHSVLQGTINAYRVPAALYSKQADIIVGNSLWYELRHNELVSSESFSLDFSKQLFKACGHLNDHNYGRKYSSWILEDLKLMFQFRVVSDNHHNDVALLIFAFSLASIQLPKQEHIQLIFGLTEKESHICHQLCAGDPAKVIAHNLNISEFTVRDHIKAIYRKTSCNSQIDLTRLIYSIPG